MEAGATRRGFGATTTVGAIFATVFFPLLALIAALIWLGNEADSDKRAFLRSWAWVSAVWLVVPVVLVFWLASVRL
jgi:fumarate reductase subunit D